MKKEIDLIEKVVLEESFVERKTAHQTSEWLLEQTKPELSLEAKKCCKLRLSSFGHIVRRQDALEKTIMLGKVESNRKRGRPNTRWTSSLREAPGLGLQELSRAVEDRACRRWLTQLFLSVFHILHAADPLIEEPESHHHTNQSVVNP